MPGNLEMETIRGWMATGVWVIASLLGPVPWVLLATWGLEAAFGQVGYSFAFVAAPALWTAMSLLAFLSRQTWGTAIWGIVGAVLWWGLL